MSQTSVNAARALHQRRVVLIASLSIALIGQGGCATARPAITSLWNQVPPVRWPSMTHESTPPAVNAAATAEPAMAANVAVKTEPVAETDSNEATASNVTLPSSQVARQRTRSNRIDFRPRENTAFADSAGLDETDSEQLVETERPDSSMERLTAALADDSVHSPSQPHQSLTATEVRARVDSLLSRARQLCELGQLDQARHSALLAQELGESARLDFSPDEERPIDLIRQIDGQLDSSKITDGSHQDNDTVGSAVKLPEPQSTESVTKSTLPAAAPGKDASGLARIRRDWSTLFRREKKPAGPETNVAALASQPVTLAPAVEVHTNDLEAYHTSAAGQRDAIVMANRSVSLAQPDRDAPPSFTTAVPDPNLNDGEINRAVVSGQSDFEDLDSRDIRSGPTRLMAASSNVMTPTDDPAAATPDFEVGEAVVPVQNVESSVETPDDSEEQENTETRQSESIILYVIFGVCSLMALACYRRGAT